MSKKTGELTVITGPMYAGKTTKLISYVKVLEKLGKRLLYIKIHYLDDYAGFDSQDIYSHDQKKIVGFHTSLNQASQIWDKINQGNVDVVIVDEVNFLPLDEGVKFIRKLLKAGIDVIASGLSYDFKREPFGMTLAVYEMADEQIQLFAVCQKCGRRAEFSERVSGGVDQIQAEEQQAEYIACCSRCHTIYH